MSRAAFSQETLCLVGVFVSPTTSGKPLTNRTTSKRPSSSALYVTSQETTSLFSRGFSKSMSLMGSGPGSPTKLNLLAAAQPVHHPLVGGDEPVLDD